MLPLARYSVRSANDTGIVVFQKVSVLLVEQVFQLV